MIGKQYEKTGIKEYFYKKEKQKDIEQKKLHSEQIKKALERGKLKESRRNCYSLSCMNHQKEYQKVKSLLDNYKEVVGLGNENIETLMLGYREYFDTYGQGMNALALRDFRKGILSTISHSKNALTMEKTMEETALREEVILDFCINHHLDLQERGLDMGMFFSLIDSLAENGAPPKDSDDIGKIREKVKSIHDELKGDKRKS